MNCKAQYDINDIRPTLLKGEVPKCTKCNKGVIKPDIVFFGEDLPEKFYNNIQNDFILIPVSLSIGNFDENHKLFTFLQKRLLFHLTCRPLHSTRILINLS